MKVKQTKSYAYGKQCYLVTDATDKQITELSKQFPPVSIDDDGTIDFIVDAYLQEVFKGMVASIS